MTEKETVKIPLMTKREVGIKFLELYTKSEEFQDFVWNFRKTMVYQTSMSEKRHMTFHDLEQIQEACKLIEKAGKIIGKVSEKRKLLKK